MPETQPSSRAPTGPVCLCRTVRFHIPLGSPVDALLEQPRHNGFGGWPSPAGLTAYQEIEVQCLGTPDEKSGYLINIKHIDEIVRSQSLPVILASIARGDVSVPTLMRQLVVTLRDALPVELEALRWWIAPWTTYWMEASKVDRVVLSQQFEFAAAHRLHCPDLSDEENRRVFGKCNAPNGHGHNYRIAVSVAIEADRATSFGRPDLERIVDAWVIDRFDHTHLNLDTSEFADLNPSVENITRVSFRLLSEPVREAGAELVGVTVWENEKTSCTYPAHAMGSVQP